MILLLAICLAPGPCALEPQDVYAEHAAAVRRYTQSVGALVAEATRLVENLRSLTPAAVQSDPCAEPPEPCVLPDGCDAPGPCALEPQGTLLWCCHQCSTYSIVCDSQFGCDEDSYRSFEFCSTDEPTVCRQIDPWWSPPVRYWDRSPGAVSVHEVYCCNENVTPPCGPGVPITLGPWPDYTIIE